MRYLIRKNEIMGATKPDSDKGKAIRISTPVYNRFTKFTAILGVSIKDASDEALTAWMKKKEQTVEKAAQELTVSS